MLTAQYAALHRARSAPEFVPTDLSGCALWLRPDASATVLNGADVAQVDDRAGSARHATQATAGRQPLWEAAGFNGRPSVRHTSGNNDALILGGSDLAAGAKSAFLVFQHTSVGLGGQCLLDLKVSGGLFCEIITDIGGGHQNVSFLFDYGSVVGSVGFAWTPDTNRHSMVIEYNGGAISSTSSYRAWLDGVAKTVVGSGSLGPPGIGSIGDRCNAAGAHVAFALAGRWADVVVYSRTLASADLTALHAYDDRYGV